MRGDREGNNLGRWSIPYPPEAVVLTVAGVGVGVVINSVQFTLSANHLQGAVPGAGDTETNATQLLLSGNSSQRETKKPTKTVME